MTEDNSNSKSDNTPSTADQSQEYINSRVMPPLGADGAPPSIYDNLNNAANSYRLGVNILLIIIVGHLLILICALEYFYTEEINDYMQ